MPDIAQDSVTIWYANLFYVAGKKCVIATNPASGYCAFQLRTTRSDIRQMPLRFAEEIEASMIQDGFESAAIRRVVDAFPGATIGRTNDRKTLAFMNQILLSVPYMMGRLDEQGMLSNQSLAQEINHAPFGPGWHPAKSLLKVLNGGPVTKPY